jgi:hypothetical protein
MSALIGSPPPKGAPPTPESIAALDSWLASIVAFRALTSDRPWTFYEQIELYLGPWGVSGYPLSYGKKYCVLFVQDEDLNGSSAGKAWVRRTLIKLQLALKDFVLTRFRAGTLAALTKDEFTSVAFRSHPQAYTQGGLSMVMMLSPRLVFHLATIPWLEFLPWSPHFGATLEQVVITGGLVVPGCLSLLSAGPIMPARSQLWGRAMAQVLAAMEARKACLHTRNLNELHADPSSAETYKLSDHKAPDALGVTGGRVAVNSGAPRNVWHDRRLAKGRSSVGMRDGSWKDRNSRAGPRPP